VQEHKSGNIAETRKDRGKVTADRNSSTLFRTVPSPTPYDFLFLNIVLCTPTQNSNQSLVGLSQERVKKVRTSNSVRSHRIDRNKGPLNMSGKIAVGIARDYQNFSEPKGHPPTPGETRGGVGKMAF